MAGGLLLQFIFLVACMGQGLPSERGGIPWLSGMAEIHAITISSVSFL